jgi:hypothetical protein
VASFDGPLELSPGGRDFGVTDLVVGTDRVVANMWDVHDCEGVFEWLLPGPQANLIGTNPAAPLSLTQPDAIAHTRTACILVRGGLMVDSQAHEWGSQPTYFKTINIINPFFP